MAISPDRQKAMKLAVAFGEKLRELTLIHAELTAVLGGGPTLHDKVQYLIGAYVPLYEREYGTRYKPTPADIKALRLLLTPPQSLEPEEIIARMASFLANKDPFYAKERHTLTKFGYSINSHAGIPGRPTEDEAAATARYLQSVRG